MLTAKLLPCEIIIKNNFNMFKIEKIIIFLIFALIFIGVFYLLSGILFPFIAGGIFAYLLNPLVNILEKKHINRGFASALVVAVFLALLVAIFAILVPVLYNQASNLVGKSPEYIEFLQAKIIDFYQQNQALFDDGNIEQAKEAASKLSASAFEFATNILKSLWSGGIALISILALIFISPVVAFYLLKDWSHIIHNSKEILPSKYKAIIIEQFQQIDKTISAYLRGQLNVCLLLGIFYATGLTIIGLDFGLLIGFFTGILTFIPFVGLFIGMAIGLLVAFFQFGDIMNISLVLAIFLFGQFLEGNFVTPKLVGGKVGLHPVWVIFGLMAFGSLLGFTGVLLAVPITAIIAVMVRFWYGRAKTMAEETSPSVAITETAKPTESTEKL